MKINASQKSARKGFTLIEMIGVLAVIAILASLLIPKIFNAINNARIGNTVVSYNTIKSATMEHYSKYNGLTNTTTGFALISNAGAVTNYDSLLLSEGFLDKLFGVKVGTASYVQVRPAVASAPDGSVASYALSGSATNEITLNANIVEAVLVNVPRADALAISKSLDGDALSNADGATTADLKGRVIYAAGDPTTVFIYVAHR